MESPFAVTPAVRERIHSSARLTSRDALCIIAKLEANGEPAATLTQHVETAFDQCGTTGLLLAGKTQRASKDAERL